MHIELGHLWPRLERVSATLYNICVHNWLHIPAFPTEIWWEVFPIVTELACQNANLLIQVIDSVSFGECWAYPLVIQLRYRTIGAVGVVERRWGGAVEILHRLHTGDQTNIGKGGLPPIHHSQGFIVCSCQNPAYYSTSHGEQITAPIQKICWETDPENTLKVTKKT